MKSSRFSVRVGWARCIARAIRSSGATSRSRSCRASFTHDPERLARFEREARMLASLNHPHIGAIYGVEERRGAPALVLELVEGETLAERIRAARIPVAEALAIARQIADALEAAHEKGIVHRDLKPANIKITADGAVKVLDFGLAKAIAERRASDADMSQSPTVTVGGTHEGVILGTAAYMSPEQARGQAVDKRTDIWAFGCVLYEMLTGRPAFAGDTITDTLAAIVHREPDWTALRSTTPPTIKRLLQRSLEKDAGRRLRDIADVRVEIDEALIATRPHADNRQRWSRRALPWALGLLAAGAAAALIGFFRSGRLASPTRRSRCTRSRRSPTSPHSHRSRPMEECWPLSAAPVQVARVRARST